MLEAKVDLDGLPPLLTGMRVDVFFKLDADGLDEVSAAHLRNCSGRILTMRPFLARRIVKKRAGREAGSSTKCSSFYGL